ncbi:YdcH family protein [Thiothrix subterranea]|uniref:YdcH family protein n=1 Tax=Thiothrix subterranea TaxID=2735563 RepID=A0AA51MPJ1_9GAMM|nr:YdcH family protein [Thiothrix subterranea]MDQ5768592.1 YdcH family protein [Thiothrix subterranea]WML87524.1 YdcH family protein [Thiothrix subterranea]
MFGESHNLATEFPEYKEQIHHLKMNDRHFARLFDDYHELDGQLHRIEQEIEVHADEFVEGLKLRRLHLKDELYGILQQNT